MKKQLLSIFAALTVGTVAAQTMAPSWSTVQGGAFPIQTAGIKFIDAVTPNVVWVSGYDGTASSRNYCWVSRSINGGSAFNSGPVFASTVNPTLGDTANYVLANLEGIDANTAWICAFQRTAPYSQQNQGGGVIYRTTNGGTSWVNMTAAGMFTDVAQSFADFVTFVTPSIGIAVGDPVNGSYEIWRTTNGGLSWSAVPSSAIPPPNSPSEYAITNLYAKQGTSNIWFGTNEGRMYYTTNSGLTWNVSNVTAASSTTLTEIAFSTPLNGVVFAVAAGGVSEMYNTTNGGATWTQIPSLSPNVGLNDIAAVPGTNQYVSVGNGNTNIISFSNNNGVTWTSYGGSGIGYLAVDFADNTTGWAGSFSGTTTPSTDGIFKYSGSPITSTAAPSSAFAIAPNLCLSGPAATLVPNNSSTGSPALTYTWSVQPAGAVFSSTSAATPTISFSSAAAYTIILTVSNTTGTNTSTQIVNVLACSAPVAAFSAPTTTVCNKGLANTTNNSTGGVPAASYSWAASPAAGVTFSPSASAFNPTIIAANPGVYNISVTADNGYSLTTATQTIDVRSCVPVINFSVPSVFYRCTTSDRLQSTNTTPVINGTNTFTWSIAPSSGVSYAPPGVNGTNISAAVSNTTFAGVYTVTLKASNLSGTTQATQTFSVDFLCLGVNENSGLSNGLNVFPNPAHDVININVPSSVDGYTVRMMNVLGSVVAEEKIAGSKESHSVNLSNKPKGVYFLTVESKSEKVTKKIVIE